ncbi:MAG: hypothetical protein Tsb0015_02150 [Simkaniaceae bacterium]
MKDIEQLRKEIDEVNGELVRIIKKRIAIVLDIATWKKRNDMPVYDGKREELEFTRLKELAKNLGLDPEEVVEIVRRIILYSKKEMQKEMADENESDYPRS